MHTMSIRRKSEGGLLRSTSLWRSGFLSPDARHALEEAALSPRSVNAHVDLVREGQRADNLFLIVDGWACRYTTTCEGGRQISPLLVPGDLCNLETLMLDEACCGVRTLTQATVLALPRAAASELMTQYPGIARAFIWLALVENAILTKLLQSVGRRPARARVAHLLCELSARLGTEHADESSFAFPLTQEQVGDALGLTAVHINRTMHALRNDGLVRFDNRQVTLPQVGQLRRIGEFDPGYLHIDQPDSNRPARASPPIPSTSKSAQVSHAGV